jgi:hypothetical protein
VPLRWPRCPTRGALQRFISSRFLLPERLWVITPSAARVCSLPTGELSFKGWEESKTGFFLELRRDSLGKRLQSLPHRVRGRTHPRYGSRQREDPGCSSDRARKAKKGRKREQTQDHEQQTLKYAKRTGFQLEPGREHHTCRHQSGTDRCDVEPDTAWLQHSHLDVI